MQLSAGQKPGWGGLSKTYLKEEDHTAGTQEVLKKSENLEFDFYPVSIFTRSEQIETTQCNKNVVLTSIIWYFE